MLESEFLGQGFLSQDFLGGGTTLEAPDEPVLTSIELVPSSIFGAPAETKQFTATAYDQHGDEIAATITFSSSNESVATIDAAGLATLVALGKTTITAESDGISDTATLRVRNATVGSGASSPVYIIRR